MSLRFKDSQVERLTRLARRLGRTPTETASLLVEEALRVSEYASITFRDSAVGRQASLLGTRLAVWHVVMIVRSYEGDVTRTAEHLEIPVVQVEAALQYAVDFPHEIEAALADNAAYDEAALRRALPTMQVFSAVP